MKALKAGRRELERARQLSRRRTPATDTRAKAGDEPVLLVIGGNPWRGNLGRGSRMKQAGKGREEQTVEGVRNTGGGT
jgi:hypothetical protein